MRYPFFWNSAFIKLTGSIVAQGGSAHNQRRAVEMLKDCVLFLTFRLGSDTWASFTSTNMQPLNHIVQKDASIVSRRMADEVILVPIRRKVEEVECLYTLNEVGARIWELLDGRRPLNVVRDALVAEFEVSEMEAEEDLLTLFDQLKQIGAIQESRQPMGESLPPAAFAVSEPGRAEPELETAVQVGVDPIAMVVTMEDHDGAYYAWKRAGVTGRILLHIDAHIDWNWIADKDPHNLLDARGLDQVDSMLEDRCLWNLSERRSEELVHIGNYIYPALQEGIVKEFYWVVPDSFVASPAKLRHLVRQFQSLKRSEERRVGKECRSRWSPYH